MKKALALLLAVAVLGSAAPADAVQKRNVPRDQNDNAISSPWYGGYQYFRATSSAEVMVCTGLCLVAALIMSTGPSTVALMLRDTAQANGSATAIGPVRFEADGTGARLPVIHLPVVFNNGISADLNGTLTDEAATILFLDLD